jgi:hypothetical protein
VDDALALDVSRALRGFGLLIDEANLALRASAFGLLAGAADQSDVSHGSVVAQMTGDGEVVDGADRNFLAHACGSAPHLSVPPFDTHREFFSFNFPARARESKVE